MSERPSQASRNPSLARYYGLAAIAALVVFAAVYVTWGRPDNQASPASGTDSASPEAKQRGNPLSTGAMTTFVFKPQPEALPDIRFLDGSGATVGLDSFRGKVVLLNVWATWCAPCREEMPDLDKLQAELGSDKFQVVALAVDKSGLAGARKFLADIRAEKLGVYVDPTGKEGTRLKVFGMPTTILVDAEGREIGRLIGPAKWDSPEAKKLIEAQLKQG
jgi:thiol-disulfide isomerase/thioredoxin